MDPQTSIQLRTKVSRSPIPAFFEGLFTCWEGFQTMRRHPRLWRYGTVPVILNIVLSIGMIGLLYYGGSALFGYLLPKLPEGIGGFLLQVVAILGIAVVAIGLVIGLWFVLGSILCGFFYSRLARQTELLLGTPESDLREVPLMYEITYALRTAGLLCVVNFGLLVLHLVPVVGSVISMVCTTYFNCFLFGWEYFDYPLALRAMSYDQKKKFVKGHRFHTLGMGAAVMGFTFIPILGAVLLTTSVVGSVLLHRRLFLS